MYTQKLSFSSSSDDDSSDDDAFDDPINSTFIICDTSTEPPIAPAPSLSRTRALNLNTSQSLINHRSDSVTISEYESNLIKYHDDMQSWSEGKQSTINEQHDFEDTMIEVIRIFVTENGRVPTDEEITSILDTTAAELTDLSDNNEIETSELDQAPPALPQRPVRMNTQEFVDITDLEERYLGEDDYELTRRLSQVRSITTPKIQHVPHGLAVKICNNSRKNWSSLKLVSKWLKLGAKERQTALPTVTLSEVQPNQPTDSSTDSSITKSKQLWHQVKIHLWKYRIVTHLKGASVKKKHQLKNNAKPTDSNSNNTTSLPLRSQPTHGGFSMTASPPPLLAAPLSPPSATAPPKTSHKDLTSLITASVRSKITKWGRIRRSICHNKVDALLNGWIASWATNIDALETLIERKGDGK